MKATPINLKLQHKKFLELGLVLSLLLNILILQVFKKQEIKTTVRTVTLEAVQVEEIPLTQQEKSQAAPSRPTVPIASEDENIPEDETIDFTDLDLEAAPPPPPPPPEAATGGDESAPIFIPYDEPPVPIGGYQAIQARLIYPEIAKKAGVEGRVMIQALIDEKGNVVRTVVMKSLGPNGCDEAAAAAIQSVKWKPAYQRDEPVKVWIAVPVDFVLR
ncbi:energy transducer TonB [bacterium]|nr:energy transducer TonB [bacterium]